MIDHRQFYYSGRLIEGPRWIDCIDLYFRCLYQNHIGLEFKCTSQDSYFCMHQTDLSQAQLWRNCNRGRIGVFSPYLIPETWKEREKYYLVLSFFYFIYLFFLSLMTKGKITVPAVISSWTHEDGARIILYIQR